MNRFSRQCLLAAAIACLVMLSGCFSKGESADPPPGGLTAAPGDGFVTLSWQPESGVEYWLFWAPGTIVDVNHPVFIKSNATTPFVIGGLVNGVTYAFTINGRKDQGPGGSPAPTVTATPRAVGEVWQVGGTAGTADLKGGGFLDGLHPPRQCRGAFPGGGGASLEPADGHRGARAR